MCAHGVACAKHRVEIEATGDRAEHQQAGQQRQPAETGDGERHACPLTGIAAVLPEADQQKGDQAGQLPGHRQDDQVVGQRNPEHRPHEGHQQRVKARGAIVRRQVVAGIEHHQQTDADDQAAKKQGQAVQAQTEAHTKRWQPGPVCASRRAGDDVGGECQQGQRRQAPCCAGDPGRLLQLGLLGGQGVRQLDRTWPRGQRHQDQRAGEGTDQQQEQ